ncbi:MAG: head completion/stabilization protein, partial [Escherichia coli]|nr:head completion/stabilization protein [Escherichia coli]MBL1014028.1 head completion/stabilization protein [Escherichia coli]
GNRANPRCRLPVPSLSSAQLRKNSRADALDIQTSDLWRDVSWAISDILRRPRIFAELC